MKTTSEVEQRWAGRRARWRRPADRPLFDPGCYGVAEIDDDTAPRAYVEASHYSGTYVAAVRRFGLWQVKPMTAGQAEAWEGPRLAGVAVLSNPVNSKVLTNVFPYLEAGAESLELGRFVLDDSVGYNGESWTLSEVQRLARQALPARRAPSGPGLSRSRGKIPARHAVHGIVMFSDPVPRITLAGWGGQPARQVFAGHIGQVYRATGAFHLGTSTKRRICVMPDGRVLSARAAQKIRKLEPGWPGAVAFLESYGAPPFTPGEQDPRRWLAAALGATRARFVKHDGCLRYAWQVGANPRQRARIRIAMPALAYPTWDAGQLPLFQPDPR